MTPGEFKVNGISSATIKAKITNWFDVTLPHRKVTLKTDIPHMDEALLLDDGGYDNREMQLTVGVWAESYQEMNTGYLTLLKMFDSGSYIPAVFYFDSYFQYRVISSDVIQSERPKIKWWYREYTIKLTVAPFKYEAVTSAQTGQRLTLVNPYNYPAKPYIKVTGSGNFTLYTNDVPIAFTGVTGPTIELDSRIQNVWSTASDGTVTNQNNAMALAAFPLLMPGTNTLSTTATTIYVEPRWRTL